MKKGQAAWGSMEVLLSVIMLGFSMGIVFFAMQSLEDTRCIATLKAQTTSLQNAMLDVALGAPPTQRKVDYSFPSCRGYQMAALRFVYYQNAKFCSICPGVYNGCWIIIPTYYDSKVKRLYDFTDASVCVNLPADVTLNILDGGMPGCLGTGRTTSNPCIASVPGATIPACTAAFSNVPASIFDYGKGCEDQPVSCWQTFAPKQGDGRTLRFILSKDIAPTKTTGVINVCAVKPG